MFWIQDVFCPDPNPTFQVVPDPDPTFKVVPDPDHTMVKRGYVSNWQMLSTYTVNNVWLQQGFYAFGSGTIIPCPDQTWPQSSRSDRTRSTTLQGTSTGISGCLLLHVKRPSCFLLGFSAAGVGQSNTPIASNTTSQIPSGQKLYEIDLSVNLWSVKVLIWHYVTYL